MLNPKGTFERLASLALVWGSFIAMTNYSVYRASQSPQIAQEIGPGLVLGFLFLLIPLGVATHKILNSRNPF